MDEPTRGTRIRACPVAIAAWLDEHREGGLASHSSLSKWRKGASRATHGPLGDCLRDIDEDITPHQLEALIQAETGPGKRWKFCEHFDGGRDIDHCPNRSDTNALQNGPSGPPSDVLSPSSLDERTHDFSEYRERARSQHETLRLIGFDERVRVAIGLKDLHVPLDVVLDHGPRSRMIYADAHHAQVHAERYATCERKTMAQAFALGRRTGKRGLALLGDPGSGKTTQLRRVLLQALADARAETPALGLRKETLPVFLPLREHQGEQELIPFMQRVLAGRTRTRVPPDLAERLADRGDLLLLFDGLDEVADAAERKRVARWIEDLYEDEMEFSFVVSSRYAGYTPDIKLTSDFLELHLRPLTDDQAQQFVTNWHTAVELKEAEIPGTRVNPQRVEMLLDDLHTLETRGSAKLYEMARNPMLLTALCLVHRRHEGTLPADREALYRECSGVLLERRRRKGATGDDDLSVEDARLALQPAALWMHGEIERRQASANELLPSVQEGLERCPQSTVTAAEFLKLIRDHSGLLTGWGLDRYGFMHLGFQEYLAALEVRHRETASDVSGPTDALRTVVERFGETWWNEIVLLMLSGQHAEFVRRFMEAMARRPDFKERTRTGLMSQLLGQWSSEVRAHLDGHLLGHESPGVRAWWRRIRGLETAPTTSVLAPSGGVQLVQIPGARFLMGSPDGVGHGDERPQHEVELAAFYMAPTPVTNAQYREYLEANPDAPRPEYWGDREYNRDEQPVVGVSWQEAMVYCEWAGLTLPTEAQWEYACRAGTETAYYSGDGEDDLKRVGWYARNSEARLHGVGELEPNGWGLYDMHGNVWEWCMDGRPGPGNYASCKTTSPEPGHGLRLKPEGNAYRIIRGGSWISGADYARSAYRIGSRPGVRDSFVVGFRPVLRPREVVESSG